MLHTSFTSIEIMADKCKEIDASGVDVWNAVASYTQPIKGSRGRTQANVARLKCFILDIDVNPLKPNAAYASLEDAEHALAEFVQAFHVPYNIIVYSGGGLHVYWLLDESISCEEWRRVALKFKDVTKLTGLMADPSRTADAASLLRPAGTTNKKPKYGDEGRKVSAYLCRFGGVTLSEFEAACDRLRDGSLGIGGTAPPPGAVVTGVAAISEQVPSWYEELSDEAREAALRSMLASLPVERIIDREYWAHIGMALAHEPRLPRNTTFQLWADWSQSTPDGAASWHEETLEESRGRFDGFDRYYGPNRISIGLLIKRAEQAGWHPDSVRKQNVDEAISQAVVEAYESRNNVWTQQQAIDFVNRHVTFARLENIYNVDGLKVKREALDTSFARNMPTVDGKKLSVSRLVKGGAGTIVDYIGNGPGKGSVFKDSEGLVVANTYRPHELVAKKPHHERAQTFHDLISHLAQGNQETKVGIKNYFKNLAWLINNPSGRIHYASVLIGKNEGSGKTTLMLNIPRAIFGDGNVRTLTTMELSKDWTDYLAKGRISVMPELRIGGRHDAWIQAEKLKVLISEDRVPLMQRFNAAHDVDNYMTIFANSNYLDAAFFGLSDRRYYVMVTTAPRMPKELSERVYDLIDNYPDELKYLVLKYGEQGRGVDPYAYPPQTSAKQAMLEANRSEWAQWIHDKFHLREHPFIGDAVSVDDVKIGMGEQFRPLPSDKVIRDELFSLADGAISIQAQRRLKGGKTETKRLIVLRDIERWKNAGLAELYDHYEETVIKKRSP
jgi:hypothetical protein